MASEYEKSEQFWANMRSLFNGARWIVAAAFAVYLLPHLILFGKWTALTPADFVPLVQQRCVPVVQAIMEYQRDHGRPPGTTKDLVPAYLPAMPIAALINAREVDFIRVEHGETVVYQLPPIPDAIQHAGSGTNPDEIPTPPEGWYVGGYFTSGPIPLPTVTIDALSRPTTVPTP